jgi:RNA polymerase sigma-70 factor (ECF subfamily)
MFGSKPNKATTNAPGNADPEMPSFQAIYNQYLNFVWSSAGHLGAGADAIDDVVQDVFIVIHSKLTTLKRPEALRSWIYGIVRRTVSDHRRSRRSRDAAGKSLNDELKSTRRFQPSPLDLSERNSDVELLETILAKLDEPKREIFIMVEVLEMTIPEVVQALEIPLNTAYSRLRLAREAFEQALAKHEAHEREMGSSCRY